jgi:hypothetical protein
MHTEFSLKNGGAHLGDEFGSVNVCSVLGEGNNGGGGGGGGKQMYMGMLIGGCVMEGD